MPNKNPRSAYFSKAGRRTAQDIFRYDYTIVSRKLNYGRSMLLLRRWVSRITRHQIRRVPMNTNPDYLLRHL